MEANGFDRVPRRVYRIRLSPEIATPCSVSELEWPVVTRLRAGTSEVEFGKGKRPKWLWVPACLLLSEYVGSPGD